jgi:phospholipid transport system substrate-binding protein
MPHPKDIPRMHSDPTRRRFLLISAAAAACFAASSPSHATGDATVARVQAFYDALLDTMKQGPQLGVQGRFDKIAPAVHAAYDIPTMMKIACGPEWSKIPADKQQALIDAFERMSAAVYADRFTKYSGQKFVVDPTPVPHNADMIVKTQLVPADGDPVQLNYLMRGPADDMRIVDVFLEGAISELATRRSEFSGVLHSDGPDVLLAKLNNLSDTSLKGH